MDGEVAALSDLGDPALIIATGLVNSVPSVYEEETYFSGEGVGNLL